MASVDAKIDASKVKSHGQELSETLYVTNCGTPHCHCYYCALCPGVIDWHNYGTVLVILECGLGLIWTLEPHFVHYLW